MTKHPLACGRVQCALASMRRAMGARNISRVEQANCHLTLFSHLGQQNSLDGIDWLTAGSFRMDRFVKGGRTERRCVAAASDKMTPGSSDCLTYTVLHNH